jgi:hypothetical protein
MAKAEKWNIVAMLNNDMIETVYQAAHTIKYNTKVCV